MDSFGLPLQLTFAAATQQAIDFVRANRLTIGTSNECGLTRPVLRPNNAPSSKVVRKPSANQTRDRLDHAASHTQCATASSTLGRWPMRIERDEGDQADVLRG